MNEVDVIDEFKYHLMLAKLESIKGTKKPITDFIKEIYTLTERFNTYHNSISVLQYTFMLVTRAMQYNATVKGINREISDKVQDLCSYLLSSNRVAISDVANVFEFYHPLTSMSISITSTIHIQYYVDFVEELPKHIPVYISILQMNEFKQFTYAETLLVLFLQKEYPNSRILEILSTRFSVSLVQSKIDSIHAQLTDSITIFNKISNAINPKELI